MNNSSYNLRAPYYDLEFNETNDEKLLESLITCNTKTILEIPSGSGRHCEWLAKTDCDVTLVDLSPDMIKEVQKKTLNKENLHVKTGDIKTYKTKRLFDLIIVPRETLQMFPTQELESIVSNLKRNLSKNGILYCDFAQLQLDRVSKTNRLPSYISRQIDTFKCDIDVRKDNFCFRRWQRTQRKGDKLTVVFRYKIKEKTQMFSFDSRLTLTNYSVSYLCHLFDKYFNINAIYGDYDGHLYKQGSERMIFLLKQ